MSLGLRPSTRRDHLTAAAFVAALAAASLAVPLVFGEPEARVSSVVDTGRASPTASLAVEAPPTTGTTVAPDPAPAAAGGVAPRPRRTGAAGATGGQPAGGEAGGAAVGSAGGASPGVSATELRVGVLVPDRGALTRLGVSSDFGDAVEQWNVFVKAVNDGGGVHGRTLVLAVRTFDPTRPDTLLAACNAMAQDDDVFLAVSMFGFQGPPVLCMTEQHGIPLVALTEFLEEYYAKSGGRLFSMTTYFGPSVARRALVSELHRAGVLKGRRIGIVSDDTNMGNDGVDKVLEPLLRDLGYQVVAKHRVAGGSEAFQQIPVSVQDMRGARADTVMLELNQVFATQWVQTAAGQAYFPRYVMSDYALPRDSGYQNMGPTFDGALGVTALRTGEQRQQRPEPARDAECRTRFEQATGGALVRGSDAYFATLTACGIADVVTRALVAAGPDPTRAGFAAAMQSLGDVAVPHTAGGRFEPGRPVAVTQARTVRWRADCRCWMPHTEFSPF